MSTPAGDQISGAIPTAVPERLRYRLLTGPDDVVLCERISAALADGYMLHGGPALTFDGDRVIAGQAVVLPSSPMPETRLV